MSLPRVVIVGRPNVGKSTLLNRLCHSRVAIVEPTEGVTRDRVSVFARLATPLGERVVEAIDTGGVGIVDRDDLGPHVERQVAVALASAQVVLLVVDARSGPTPLDERAAALVRGLAAPVLLVCNKVEAERETWAVEEFRRLGVGAGEPLAISAQNGTGIELLCERIGELLPPPAPDEQAPVPALKIAIVGRRNAGKSTLLNALAEEERVIVSEVPGTTRDALDVVIHRGGETFVVIDTAGVRRKKSHADAIEFYSDARSHKAMRRADVVFLLFDATEPLSAIEKRLARYAVDHYRIVVLCANKWDLVDGPAPEDFQAYLAQELPGLSWAPVSFLSAKTGFNVAETFDLALELQRQATRRVPTAELNRVLERALASRSPSRKGHMVRVRYATQAEVAPPTFVLFVNDKRLIGKDWLRYLENRLREELGFEEVPIHVVLRDKHERAAALEGGGR